MKPTKLSTCIVSMALASLLITSCQQEEKVAKQLTTVNITEATAPYDNSDTYTTTAVVKAGEEMQMAFKVSGTISRIYVKEGQKVRKGTLLATIDDRDYQRQLKATEAEYESVKATADRVIQLYGEEATSAENYDKARYGLEQISVKLQHARDQVADTRIYAPVDGYVQDIIFRDNETVGAGMPVITIEGDNKLQIEVNLPSRIAMRRDEIVSAVCRMESSGESFSIIPVGMKQKASASQTYTATFDLPSESKALIGEACTVDLKFTPSVKSDNTTDATAIIPATSLLQKEGETKVYVCGNDSVLRPVKVEVERIDRSGDAYVKGGVKSGEKVVSTGVHHVRAGEKVNPISHKELTEKKGGLL